jgi:hypothetical protein
MKNESGKMRGVSVQKEIRLDHVEGDAAKQEHQHDVDVSFVACHGKQATQVSHKAAERAPSEYEQPSRAQCRQ